MSRRVSKLLRFMVSLAASSYCAKNSATVIFDGTNSRGSSLLAIAFARLSAATLWVLP
jgi:hypothetical protein